MLKGSCACGQVRYEIWGDLLAPITYCHCWRCRKQSRSSFGTTAGLKATCARSDREGGERFRGTDFARLLCASSGLKS